MNIRRWYVIQTKPRDETRCVLELSRKGIETLCPMMRDYRWRRKRYESVPLFPGYVFARFVYPESFYKVIWTPGVSRLVQFGETPSHLSDSVVSLMKNAMDSEGLVDQDPRCP